MHKSLRTIKDNADRLVQMHLNIDATFKNKAKNPEAWSKACALYHASYDALAFPGGLEASMLLLKQGDLNSADRAIDFLEANPYFHRSGYIKEDILRYLGRINLNHKQIERLQKIILARLEEKQIGREYKRYSNLAKKMGIEIKETNGTH